jgi:PAS domain S-box-containing protein
MDAGHPSERENPGGDPGGARDLRAGAAGAPKAGAGVSLEETRRVLLLMDHSLDFVELLGVQGVIKGVSAAIKTLAGYDPAELTGRHYQELLHPDDCAAAAAAFTKVLRGERIEPIRLRYRLKNGSWRTVQASARNFLNDPGVRAIVVVTRDLTELIDTENSLRQSNVELRRLSQELIDAQENERRHLARELHDDVQQILVGLRLGMEAARRTPTPLAPEGVIDGWIAHVQEVIDHLHNLTTNLRALTIGEHGLRAEICLYIEHIKLAEGQNLRLELGDGLGTIAPHVDLACFRIVQEALNNAVRHSHARHLKVALLRAGNYLTVSIGDDGVGFDVKSAQSRAITQEHFGLLGMRERASLAGGRLKISSSIGHGTRVSASFRRTLN